MNELPTFWRTETYHALSVHFPIAFLSLAAATGIFYLLFYNSKRASSLRFTVSLLVGIGIIAYWIAFYTGRNAYSVVVRTICDPFVLKDHLYWANVGGYLFSAAFLMDVIYHFLKDKLKRIANYLTIFLLIAGAVSIGYVGHLGANVVYQQGGGVYVPTEDCSEYE